MRFFCVINIITKKARALGSVAVEAEAASFRTRQAAFTVGKRFAHGVEGLLRVSDTVSRGIDRNLLADAPERGTCSQLSQQRGPLVASNTARMAADHGGVSIIERLRRWAGGAAR